MAPTASRSASQSASCVRAAAERSAPLTFDQTCSIGLKSGEYGGRYHTPAPARRTARATARPRCACNRSSTTTSPGRRHGTSTCSTYAANVAASIAPVKANGATRPSARAPATSVVARQWDCGTWPTTRSPRGARPYNRPMAVFTPVSSRKTQRLGSMPAARPRKVARLCRTSGRPCSAARGTFFLPAAAAAPAPGRRC